MELLTSFLINGLFLSVPTLFLTGAPAPGLAKSFFRKGLSFKPPPILPGPVLDSATAIFPGDGGVSESPSMLGVRRGRVIIVAAILAFSVIGGVDGVESWDGVLRLRLGKSLMLGKVGMAGDEILLSIRIFGGPCATVPDLERPPVLRSEGKGVVGV